MIAALALSAVIVGAKPGVQSGSVFIFINSDCPIANSYAPELKRVMAKFGTEFSFKMVYCDPSGTAQMAMHHLKEYGYPCGFLLDPGHKLASANKVTTVPTAVVKNSSGKTVYHGRIDNTFASIGKRRPNATEFDLRDALSAVQAGKPVKTPKTSVIGCIL